MNPGGSTVKSFDLPPVCNFSMGVQHVDSLTTSLPTNLSDVLWLFRDFESAAAEIDVVGRIAVPGFDNTFPQLVDDESTLPFTFDDS